MAETDSCRATAAVRNCADTRGPHCQKRGHVTGFKEKWVLAFDGSCDTCSAVSDVVARASDGKLEVLPLAHPRVQEWRERSMGSSPKWAPTLLRVRGDTDVRAWTGSALSLAVARRLGPRSSVQVLRALGELRAETRGSGPAAVGAGFNRKRFLHLAGGALAVIGLSAAGQNSAFAKASENAKASAWVEANMDRLPRTYEEMIRHPIPYRQAVYDVLSPQERSQAWLEHFHRFRSSHPSLSPTQERIIRELADLTPRVMASPSEHTPELRRLSEAARRSFGLEQAAALLTRLGPDDGRAPQANCQCSQEDPYWCGLAFCGPIRCTTKPSGCGDLWQERCDGLCMS
ncbi:MULTISPECIES: bacteriocin fulvocin C-related protein [Streptomyces]|uniref:bacteriocin fulvocin C-related protein n=1 Tax=Streptomyces TaxID=1883 RepID=UPI0037DA7453